MLRSLRSTKHQTTLEPRQGEPAKTERQKGKPHLAEVVRGDASHVVVHRREHRDGVLRHVHPRENLSRLADAGEALRQQLGREVVQMLLYCVVLCCVS